MSKFHHYKVEVRWTGNTGQGTETYRGYERAHAISVAGKQEISGSSDPAFRGDRSRYNPEELLVASLSACHMLFFLHFCADAGIVVTDYSDEAEGEMEEDADGKGRFKTVTLKPKVLVKDASMTEKINALHEKAHQFCFIANSCNFPILIQLVDG